VAVVAGGWYPVVASIVNVPFVAPVKVPDRSPDEFKDSPGGRLMGTNELMDRPLKVVTLNWKGVMTLFWKYVGEYAGQVKTSRAIVKEMEVVLEAPRVSVAVKMTDPARLEVGVPFSVPVVVLKVRPTFENSKEDA
jgi:hypothetical protein